MSEVVAYWELVQGSPEWHELRDTHDCASEAASACDDGAWEPKTRRQLSLRKQGLLEVRVNAAMQRGTKFEEEGIMAFEQLTGAEVFPVVVTRGRMLASLDGATTDLKTIVELKIPAKGVESDLYAAMQTGAELPAQYMYQMAHQHMVVEPDQMWFAVYVPETGDILAKLMTPDMLSPWKERVIAGWREFDQWHWDKNETPPPGPKDMVDRSDDAELVDLFNDYATLTAEKTELEEIIETVRNKILTLTGRQNTICRQARVTWYSKAGSVNYKNVPELKGVDLDKYRGKGSLAARITLGDKE